MRKTMTKGQVQDALEGTKAPEAAGTFVQTGVQSVGNATLGVRDVGSFVPSDQEPSSIPGVVARLRGGESPYAIPAEAGLDLTPSRLKKAKKRARKARRKVLRHLKRAMKAGNGGDLSSEQMAALVTAVRSASDIQLGDGRVLDEYAAKQVRKVARDPVAALARLELLCQQLRPNHPARMRGAAVVLKSKLLANDTAVGSGSVRKALGAIDPLEILSATREAEAALGVGPSSVAFQPAQLDAETQLRRIVSGRAPAQSLRGTQAPGSVRGGPAAQLGLMLKNGAAEAIAKAEAEVKVAEQSGDAVRLSQAQERLTYERLLAVHRAGVGC